MSKMNIVVLVSLGWGSRDRVWSKILYWSLKSRILSVKISIQRVDLAAQVRFLDENLDQW